MKKMALLFFTVFFLTTAGFGDNIFLKDGTLVKGQITQSTEIDITVQTEYGVMTIPKSKISNINYDQISPKEQTQYKPVESKQKIKKDGTLDNPESWYMSFFFGFGRMKGEDDLKLYNPQIEKNASFFLNLSFYGTVNNKLLMGGGISALATTWDSYDDSNTKTVHTLSASLIHADFKIFFKEIASGFFFSISPGFATIHKTSETMTIYRNEQKFEGSGLGIKAGFGVAINLNRFNNCFNIGVDGFYASTKTKQDNIKLSVSGAILYLGWLW